MLKRNLIANYVGQAWVALIGLLLIPIYIKYLGIEAYGLIGILALMQSALILLDLGLSSTLNREMANFSANNHGQAYIRNLLRTVEIIGFTVAVMIGVGIWLSSNWIAADWIQVSSLSHKTLINCLSIMGVILAFRFLDGLYKGVILGFQCQVQLNFANCILITLRGLGSLVTILYISQNIVFFFYWQLIISVVTTITLIFLAYNALPKGRHSAKFSFLTLKNVGRFTLGVTGITITSILATQSDKVVLSKILSLSNYGFYTLATVLAGTLYLLVTPITQAWFPHLNKLLKSNQEGQFIEKYHQGAQLVSIFMGSAAITMMAYPEEILQIWTNDNLVARECENLLRLLALGNLLHGLMWIPYQAQLAYGWTRLGLIMNLLASILIVPTIIYIAPRYGVEGAAWVWVSLSAAYLFFGAHFMYRKILCCEKIRWYLNDIFIPLTGALLCCLLMKWIMPEAGSIYFKVFWVILSGVLVFIAAIIGSCDIRDIVVRKIISPILYFIKGQ
jgi:O-antigen/teichoic acid export membrane protein